MIAGIVLKLLASVLALGVAAAIYFLMSLVGLINMSLPKCYVRILQVATIVTLIAIWVIPV